MVWKRIVECVSGICIGSDEKVMGVLEVSVSVDGVSAVASLIIVFN